MIVLASAASMQDSRCVGQSRTIYGSWTPDDQVVFRRWRRGVILFYGVAFCLLAVTSMFARRHDKGHVFPDIIVARRQAASPSTGARMPYNVSRSLIWHVRMLSSTLRAVRAL
jgi:hypothetical protein